MMTERLYYDDAYLTEFDAAVECCREGESGWLVRLDRSAFYPTSGGQPYDTGTLNGARVTDVQVLDGDVWHTVDRPLNEGERVRGTIDWPRRFDHMQQHAADHMIAGRIWSRFGGVTIGLHESDEVSTIDVQMPDGRTHLTDEEIRAVERDVNERIQRDVPIRCWFPSAEELEALPLRKKPTVSEHVRVVAIGDDEMVACGGTHPSTAGQIGLVKIVSVAPARGTMRVGFVAGMRALNDYFRCFEAAHAAAERFSAGIDQLPANVEALQQRLREVEAEKNALRREKLLGQAEQMLEGAEALPGGVRLTSGFVDADAGAMRELASKLVEKERVVALLGVRNGASCAFVFGRSRDLNLDMGALLRTAAKAFDGKGGGKPDFAQGGGREEILAAARENLKKQMETEHAEL